MKLICVFLVKAFHPESVFSHSGDGKGEGERLTYSV